MTELRDKIERELKRLVTTNPVRHQLIRVVSNAILALVQPEWLPIGEAVVSWRYRSDLDPEWQYFDKKLLKKDLARKDPGFEEQALYFKPPVQP